ncbi:unnamed protein product [Adineta ricciae]|uniref:Uncharacterized protein n=1 Tax=Adineta ricciae TaxID=249248 RepID=A0A813PTV1_ADIRI|nr:unnamed protein product [Adineta ricciae]CAF1373618.1 unnamed protein product [Adineta ricciae]
MDSTNIVIPFDFPFAILEHRHNSDPNSKLVYAVADGQYTYGPLSLYQYHNDEHYSKTIRDDELPPSLPCKEFYIVESGFTTDDAFEIIDENRGQIYVKELPSMDDDSMMTIDQEPEQVHMKELFKEMAECKNEIRNLKSIVLSENRFNKRRSTSTDSPGLRSTENNAKWIRGGTGNRSTNNGHMSDDGGVSTPLRYTKTTGIRKPQQVQSSIVQRSVSSTMANKNILTPLRGKTGMTTSSSMSSVTSKYATPMRTTTAVVTNKKVVLKNVKSSGYGQFSVTNNTTTMIKKQQQQLATLATPNRAFRK